MTTDTTSTPVTTLAAMEALPRKRRDYKPAPGRVTVLRERVESHYSKELDLVKHPSQVEFEQAFAIFATVARVGDPISGGTPCWFAKGDVVSIIPSMFERVELAPGLDVWVGPASAVTGKFEDVPEE